MTTVITKTEDIAGPQVLLVFTPPPPPPLGSSYACQQRKRQHDQQILEKIMTLWKGVNEAWEMYNECQVMLKKALADNNLPRALVLSEDIKTGVTAYCAELQRLLGHPSVIPEDVFQHDTFQDEIRRRLADEGELLQLSVELKKLEVFLVSYFYNMDDFQSLQYAYEGHDVLWHLKDLVQSVRYELLKKYRDILAGKRAKPIFLESPVAIRRKSLTRRSTPEPTGFKIRG